MDLWSLMIKMNTENDYMRDKVSASFNREFKMVETKEDQVNYK